MKATRTLVAFLAVVVACSTLSAQTESEDSEYLFLGPEKVELSLSSSIAWGRNSLGTGLSVSDDDFFASGSAELGYCFYDVPVGVWFISSILLEGGFLFDIQFSDFNVPQVNSDVETLGLVGGPKLTLNLLTQSRVIPYVFGAGGASFFNIEGNLDGVDISGDDPGGFIQLGGGVRLFITDSASVNIGVRYQKVFVDLLDDPDDIAITFGLSLYFGGPK